MPPFAAGFPVAKADGGLRVDSNAQVVHNAIVTKNVQTIVWLNGLVSSFAVPDGFSARIGSNIDNDFCLVSTLLMYFMSNDVVIVPCGLQLGLLFQLSIFTASIMVMSCVESLPPPIGLMHAKGIFDIIHSAVIQYEKIVSPVDVWKIMCKCCITTLLFGRDCLWQVIFTAAPLVR